MVFMTLSVRTFENMVGNEENAGNQHFLPFPPYFLPNSWQITAVTFD